MGRTSWGIVDENRKLKHALEQLFPAEEGFTHAFEQLRGMSLIVEVPADASYQEEWGDDEETMWVWYWKVDP